MQARLNNDIGSAQVCVDNSQNLSGLFDINKVTLLPPRLPRLCPNQYVNAPHPTYLNTPALFFFFFIIIVIVSAGPSEQLMEDRINGIPEKSWERFGIVTEVFNGNVEEGEGDGRTSLSVGCVSSKLVAV
ncbi:hypothetical protein WMY93_022490 [Mugilogobius chulae]|uniref:Uncharacterized protein n=1 Tax=Mugilogobius chulae TaxID=88201 RepID=A0AAW0N898_9GOBI